ncbi:MAG: nucleotidyltransferase family protein [Kineosporiaceae bacterium]
MTDRPGSGPVTLAGLAAMVAETLGVPPAGEAVDDPLPPVATEPVATEPVATGRDVTGPGVTGRGVAGPGATGRVEAVAQEHGVLGLLPAHGPSGAAVTRFRAESRDRLVRALADLRTVAAGARRVGAPLAVLKGVALATSVYPRPDLRPFADVDVLTTPAAFGDVLAELEAAGGRVRTRNWTAMSELRSSEVTVLMPAGTAVDLHWHVVNLAGLRRRFRLGTQTLLDPGPGGGAGPEGTDVPRPEAHLGYVCWHLVVSGGVRLLWACDVELLAQRGGVVAADLLAWTRRTRTTLTVAVALDFAAALFPGGAAARLAAAFPPSPWRRANARLKHAVVSRPVGRWSGSFLPRATRTTTWDSLAALRPPLAALTGRLAPDQETLDIMPIDSGGPAGRAAYLRAVATGRW